MRCSRVAGVPVGSTMSEHVEVILSDEDGPVLTMDDGTALLVDWYDWDNEPQVFVDIKTDRSWTEVACHVRAVECSMGRSLTTEPVEAGLCRITFDNRGGQFTDMQKGQWPFNEKTEVRIRLHHPTLDPEKVHGETVLWAGITSEWEQEWDYSDDQVVVEAVDVIARLHEQGGALAYATGNQGDSVWHRLEHLIARAGLNDMHTYLEYGQTALINPSQSGKTVLEQCQVTALSDGGHFFAEPDQWGMPSVVYLDRHRFVRPPLAIAGWRSARVASNTDRNREDNERELMGGYLRRAQTIVPTFSDMCDDPEVTNGLYPYSDLEWRYRAWEVPSVVVVSNEEPEQEYDRDGNELPHRWKEVGHIAVGRGRRHNVIEYTGLHFQFEHEAVELGELYADVLSKSQLDVTKLTIYPEVDNKLWDIVAGKDGLRQGDLCKIVRHLQTDRIVAVCRIEGVSYQLLPDGRDDRSGVRWTVDYRLSALDVTVTDIPPHEYPPRPPGFPGLAPPLPPAIPDLDLAVIGSTFGAQPPTSFAERNDPMFQFVLTQTDGTHSNTHRAYAYNDIIGRIELSRLSSTGYNGDFVSETYANVQLAPGMWTVWLEDSGGRRRSNQIAVVIPEWDDPEITALSPATFDAATLTWELPQPRDPRPIVLTYTDDRYPHFPIRLFVTGTGVDDRMEIPVTWAKVGNPVTTNTFTLTFDPDILLSGDYQLELQDAGDFNRKSTQVNINIPTPIPGRPYTDMPDLQEWEPDSWDDLIIRWEGVPHGESYRLEYRELGDPDWRSKTVDTTMTTITGGRSTSSDQTEKVYELRVQAQVNGQYSGWSQTRIVESGYPYTIVRDEWEVTDSGHGVYGAGQVFGLRIDTNVGPSWTQNRDPSADLFVGIEARRFTAMKVRSRQRFFGWFVETNSYAMGDIATDRIPLPNPQDANNPRRLYIAEGPITGWREMPGNTQAKGTNKGDLNSNSVPATPNSPWADNEYITTADGARMMWDGASWRASKTKRPSDSGSQWRRVRNVEGASGPGNQHEYIYENTALQWEMSLGNNDLYEVVHGVRGGRFESGKSIDPSNPTDLTWNIEWVPYDPIGIGYYENYGIWIPQPGAGGTWWGAPGAGNVAPTHGAWLETTGFRAEGYQYTFLQAKYPVNRP